MRSSVSSARPSFLRLLTGFDGNRLTLYLDLTARERVCTEDGTHRLGTARTHQSIETGNLTCTSVERNALQRVALPDVGNFEQLLARLYVNLRVIVGHFTANHHGYHLIDGDVLNVYRIDVLAIAEDGQTIANLHNFFQSVGDVNDCYALLFQSVDDLEQAGNFLFSQRRSRLVHDDDVAVERERLCNLDHLHLTYAQRGYLCLFRNIRMDAVQQLTRLAVHGLPVDLPAGLGRLTAHEDVLRNREVFQLIQLPER